MEPCRKLVRDRIFNDVLGGVSDAAGGGWRVLVLDELTTKTTSSVLKMSDILERNVSVVEDLAKVREPLPLAAIYFIQPTAANIARLVADFATKPLYPSAHVFFSSKVSRPPAPAMHACAIVAGRVPRAARVTRIAPAPCSAR